MKTYLLLPFFLLMWTLVSAQIDNLNDLNLSAETSALIDEVMIPTLTLVSTELQGEKGNYDVHFNIKQSQEIFVETKLSVVVKTTTNIYQEALDMKSKELKGSVKVEGCPLEIIIEPQGPFLNGSISNEVPTLSKVYKAKKTIIVMPTLVSEREAAIYSVFARKWQASHDGVTIVKDLSLMEMPKDKTIWFLGTTNQHVSKVNRGLEVYDAHIGPEGILIEDKLSSFANTSTILTTQHPLNPKQSIVFLTINSINAVPSLLGQLPNYSEFSFLSFQGDKATNTVKGQWPIIQTPLGKVFREGVGPKTLGE